MRPRLARFTRPGGWRLTLLPVNWVFRWAGYAWLGIFAKTSSRDRAAAIGYAHRHGMLFRA